MKLTGAAATFTNTWFLVSIRVGIDFLGAWLIDFASEHPELKLNISLSNDKKNLIKEDIDLAFRVGPRLDSSAINSIAFMGYTLF
ncbi:hypothetical protein N482_18220 [Pseudoalteromonas luteoviolacea NCIMB 1942]|uniref:LysR substrate-binding domain-containing protein n=2 Tax=Pseudoalteromonas luteoviolacea TaxID=43657 RepID=A0A166Z5Y4_9GAMM|nr:hypothetical protein N482_18220 [Pseudoalteromonas luteoviolacea NCIMB 1942]